jgi:hypothetical protein
MRERQIGSILPSTIAVVAIAGLLTPCGTALGARARHPTAGGHPKKTHSEHAKTAPNRDWDSAELWATVDVCNAPDQPDTIGIRGSMPGDGDWKDDMYIRFQVEYLQITTHTWTDVSPGGESTWMRLGPSSAVRQGGQTFQFVPPPAETASFTLRGVVGFQWRRGAKVIHSATRITTAGHKSLAGADPAGFSAASCQMA